MAATAFVRHSINNTKNHCLTSEKYRKVKCIICNVSQLFPTVDYGSIDAQPGPFLALGVLVACRHEHFSPVRVAVHAQVRDGVVQLLGVEPVLPFLVTVGDARKFQLIQQKNYNLNWRMFQKIHPCMPWHG